MTISKEGWLSGCLRAPGPLNKMYPQPNAGEGICVHSVEGTYAGALGELMKPERQASWMFTNCLDGRFIQHYPITASTWSSGNVAANTRLWAVESEGFAGTPLNASQVANMLYLASEWEQHSGLDLVRKKTLHEHGEVYNWSVPNAGPTACPSNRYLPFYEALANREDEVTKEEFEAFKEATNKRLYQLEVTTWGEKEAGIPRGKDHPYPPMNQFELASGRTVQAQNASHTHEVTVTLK